MKPLLTFLVVASFAGIERQLPSLDLTMPIATAGPQWVSTFSDTAELQVAITLVDLADQEYDVGNEFLYEVEITNTSTAALSIPWSANPALLTDVADGLKLEASVNLFINNGASQEKFLTGATMYGRSDVPASMLVLNAGASARIRAAGSWSVAGVRMSTFIAPQNGRSTVHAIYRLQRGAILASTPSSAPRALTLRMPGQ